MRWTTAPDFLRRGVLRLCLLPAALLLSGWTHHDAEGGRELPASTVKVVLAVPAGASMEERVLFGRYWGGAFSAGRDNWDGVELLDRTREGDPTAEEIAKQSPPVADVMILPVGYYSDEYSESVPYEYTTYNNYAFYNITIHKGTREEKNAQTWVSVRVDGPVHRRSDRFLQGQAGRGLRRESAGGGLCRRRGVLLQDFRFFRPGS